MGFIEEMDGPDLDCQPTHVVIEWDSGAFAPQDSLFLVLIRALKYII